MNKVRVGIIGCGMITKRRHAPEYAANPKAEIKGFFDVNFERAQEYAAIYNAKAYPSVAALIADPEIDAVSICTPNFTHAEYSVRALEAGKHVLCEKPVALKLKDSHQMIQTAEAVGKILMLGHNQRLLPTHKKAKEVLDTGVIGNILYIQTNFKHSGPENWSIDRSDATWFFDKEKAQFGALGDLGAHKLDVIRFMTGSEVSEVNARLMTLDKRYPSGELIDIEDNATAMFRLDNGVEGLMEVGWTNYGTEDNSTIIYGDKGVMKIFGDYSEDIVLEMRDGSVVKYVVGKIATNTDQIKSGIIDAFVSSVAEGTPPLITGVDGHNTLAVIVACIESSKTGLWTKVRF